MAKEEENAKPPALIDYYGEPDEQTDDWSEANFKNYWSRRLVAVHKMSALPWTIKDHTLWKRLVNIYSPVNLVAMIDHWLQSSDNPSNFAAFYMSRDRIYNTIRDKDWEWE